MLCSNHFDAAQYTTITRERLTRFAIPNGEGRELLAKFREEEAIAESDRSKNQSAASDHSKNQTAVSDHSKNQTAVSDHCEGQPAVNINEDVLDDQYSAGVGTHSDDDCHNISDDDCRAVDDDSSFYHDVSKLSDDKDDVDMEPQNLDKNEDLHDGFRCNYCSGEIKGYRYTCVQCPDYDLCASCEARGAHCLHYVLRIPRPKPYTEIQPLLLEIRRLLSGAHKDELWTPSDEIKEELIDDFDPLDIDCVMPASSETEVEPEMSTITSTTKSQRNKQDDNDTVPVVMIQPLLTSHLHSATTHTRHKETVTVDRSAPSTSSPRLVKIAPERSFLTFESSLQAVDKNRTLASESSQYTASTRLAPDGNTVLTTESSPQVIDKTRKTVSVSSPYPLLARLAPQRIKPLLTLESRTPASESSQYTASTRLAPDGNPVLTIESSPQAIDNTRTPASESSLFTASTSVSSDGNTVLTIATNVGDTDSASRPVPATPALHAPASITPGDTETVSNKIKITGDSRLQVPMATKRKCGDNIEASKPSQVVLLKGSKKFIVVPSISKVIGPGTRFKIIKRPSAIGQPQAPVAVSAAEHRTQSTQRDHHAAT